MTTFEILFPLVAVLSVPLMAWLMLSAARREAQSFGVHVEARPGLAKLLAGAIVVSLAYLVARGMVPRSVLPGNTLAILVALGGFHGLWWGMGMPLVRAQDRTLQAHRASSTEQRRCASLHSRSAKDYLPASLLKAPLLIAVLGVAALAWRLMAAPVPPLGLAAACGFALVALGELALYRWWLSTEVTAPQAIKGTDPARQEREWEALRRFRVRAVFGMHCVLPAVFFVCAVLTVEAARGSLSGADLGLLGGILGVAVGLAGGIIGVVADLQRRRFNVRQTLS